MATYFFMMRCLVTMTLVMTCQCLALVATVPRYQLGDDATVSAALLEQRDLPPRGELLVKQACAKQSRCRPHGVCQGQFQHG